MADFKKGDAVYWLDPDDGECSGFYIIESVVINGDEPIYRLKDGPEAFEHELS